MMAMVAPCLITPVGLRLRVTGDALGPASLDTPPQDLGVEDHATGAPLSVRKTDAALGLLEDLLAIEMILASDVLTAAPSSPVPGAGTEAALRTVEDAIATADPRADAVHQALRDHLSARRTTGHADPPPAPRRPPSVG
jgi:histidine ammonia-lyase